MTRHTRGGCRIVGRTGSLDRVMSEAPLIFEIGATGGWAIRAGFSLFLVAEGSGWSRSLGEALFKALRHNGGVHSGAATTRYMRKRHDG